MSEESKKLIINLVTNKPSIKGTDLVVDYLHAIYSKENESFKDGFITQSIDVVELVNEMVKEGDIREVEYVIPTMNYRVKSLYFPKGTKISLPT